MIPAPPINRPGMKVDLTRWNRAALSRFRYVDGDAATWLEELRVALLGLYMTDVPVERRLPEEWRDFFSSELFEPREDPVEEAARVAALTERRIEADQALAWLRLLPEFVEKRETALRRNRRLLDQYDRSPDEYGWEIMRAFARAAHVLLGHADAYANEGYIRTATQWDNVRRLAAMVNYQPAPPASAITDVALILDKDKGPAEIGRGLAMKYAPPEGGAPLIFETLKAIMAHPDLNAARAVDWDRNEALLNFAKSGPWTAPRSATLASGDLAVLLNIAAEAEWDTTPPKPPQAPVVAEAVSLNAVVRDHDAGTAAITVLPLPAQSYPAIDAALLTEPAQVLQGQPKSSASIIAVIMDQIAQYTMGGLAQFQHSGGHAYARILSVDDGVLRMAVDSDLEIGGEILISPMIAMDLRGTGNLRYVETRRSKAVFDTPGGIIENTFDEDAEFDPKSSLASGTVKSSGSFVAHRIKAPQQATIGYLLNNAYEAFEVVREPPTVIVGRPSAPTRTVRFLGKPPKGLEAGGWFAARSGNTIFPLRVEGVRNEPGSFFIEFHDEVATPEATEFHGPMRQRLRPVDHDRRHDAAIVDDAVVLTAISEAAKAMIRPRRSIFVEHDRAGVRSIARAQILEIVPVATGLRVSLSSDTDMSTWDAGWTVFRINTVQVSEGETKGAKTLGSGDAEVRRQQFEFDVKRISFAPSTAAEAGVAPDIDVSVNDVVWPYRDMIDPTARDEQAWSYVLTEDGGLTLHFRQRLITGFNNIKIARHRIGVGAKGSGVPRFSFTKPMKKHRYVTAIVQPFETEGGSDREPASAIRQSAPGRLVANGRAVSLSDFENLSRRHASVWRARATQMISAGAAPGVLLTVVPANGGGIDGIKADLAAYIRARALPGVQFAFEKYQDFPVSVTARIQVDFAAYDKNEVQEAAVAALSSEFRLQQRDIGQPFYIAEIMAALEKVEGVSSTTITDFGPALSLPPTGGFGEARLSKIGTTVAAIIPTGKQVAWLTSVSITPEATE